MTDNNKEKKKLIYPIGAITNIPSNINLSKMYDILNNNRDLVKNFVEKEKQIIVYEDIIYSKIVEMDNIDQFFRNSRDYAFMSIKNLKKLQNKCKENNLDTNYSYQAINKLTEALIYIDFGNYNYRAIKIKSKNK